jgi:hypothetical protein
MGERPSKIHSLDRLSNSRGYEPGNVRWATHKEQQNNRSNNYLITANGTTKTLAAWAEDSGLLRKTIKKRLESGMSPEAAVDPSFRVGAVMITIDGTEKTARAWAIELGVHPNTFRKRVERGELPPGTTLVRTVEK